MLERPAIAERIKHELTIKSFLATNRAKDRPEWKQRPEIFPEKPGGGRGPEQIVEVWVETTYYSQKLIIMS